MPKLEERRRAALSDSEKYTTMLEKLKAHKQTLRDKIDTRLEEEKRLKVKLNYMFLTPSKFLKETASRKKKGIEQNVDISPQSLWAEPRQVCIICQWRLSILVITLKA